MNEPYQLKNKMDEHITIDEAESIILSYTQNIILFEFSALEYTEPIKNQYAYKLEGFTDDWIYIGEKREVNFTNLNPGNYTLTVKAFHPLSECNIPYLLISLIGCL